MSVEAPEPIEPAEGLRGPGGAGAGCLDLLSDVSGLRTGSVGMESRCVANLEYLSSADMKKQQSLLEFLQTLVP